MNKILIGIGLFIFMSCIEKQPNSLEKENTATLETNETENISEVNIPTFNFNELEPLLNKRNDTTYIVNFWATWCKPCIKELPAFEKINKLYASQKVKVLLVSLDFPKHLESQLIPFVEKRKIKSNVILLDDPDANGWIPKVNKEWSGAIPATLLYNNTERKFHERSFTYEEIETELISILNKYEN